MFSSQISSERSGAQQATEVLGQEFLIISPQKGLCLCFIFLDSNQSLAEGAAGPCISGPLVGLADSGTGPCFSGPLSRAGLLEMFSGLLQGAGPGCAVFGWAAVDVCGEGLPLSWVIGLSDWVGFEFFRMVKRIYHCSLLRFGASCLSSVLKEACLVSTWSWEATGAVPLLLKTAAFAQPSPAMSIPLPAAASPCLLCRARAPRFLSAPFPLALGHQPRGLIEWVYKKLEVCFCWDETDEVLKEKMYKERRGGEEKVGSKDELVDWAKQIAMKVKTYLIINRYQRSRTADRRSYVILACERGGRANGKSENWQLFLHNGRHNHKIAVYNHGHVQAARLTEEQLQQTEQFRKSHVLHHNILRFFQEQDVGCAVSAQKINDVVAKIKKDRMQGRNMVEEVLCLSAHQGYTVFYRKCEESNLIKKTNWEEGSALYEHWMDTPDHLYVIANTFNFCVVLIAWLGSTTVLPLYLNMDCTAGTLFIEFISEQEHFIQMYESVAGRDLIITGL
ncbi:hypothetical protein M9H77_31460 [Catharanthus roseus]|uniref:Uncharacterized protein n=1 Tax=Catharanthus roseus TaxID=4058 RepID=A0ACC0A2I8_CATRO|nr:hypothetical protein M9H77_31460 [Catharanthus roseus]